MSEPIVTVRWRVPQWPHVPQGYTSRRRAEQIAADLDGTVQRVTTTIEDVGLHWLDCAGSSILADGTKQIALAFDDGRWAYPCGPNHVIHESVGSLEAAKTLDDGGSVVKCPSCNGTGWELPSCTRCQGRGQLLINHETGSLIIPAQLCTDCNGSGRLVL